MIFAPCRTPLEEITPFKTPDSMHNLRVIAFFKPGKLKLFIFFLQFRLYKLHTILAKASKTHFTLYKTYFRN